MKFLIVDDSRLVRMKLKAELCDRGHSVVEARDGEEALARVDADAPDAVFLDLILPELDGISVLRRLHATRPQLPVTVLSTAATEENIAAAEECGAVLFIRKPYADSEITAAIGKMRRRLEDV
ncbi:response regulator [uncultured Selenomonas sp.]|uniref:response regulator transcription factor n=1 Tax=uncultured Selenomonas sp. TaxID=159275 RepID=UPI0028EBC88E|nr:response regulator [uncultured Selenomonas sp.]